MKSTIEELGLKDELLTGAEYDQIPPEREDDWKWEWISDSSPMPLGAALH